MWHLFENLKSGDPHALERYLRDEHLVADLELHLARERGSLSSLERELYAASSYFAA